MRMERIDPPAWAPTTVEVDDAGGSEARGAFAEFLGAVYEELGRRITTIVNERSARLGDIVFAGTYYIESERYEGSHNRHLLWIMFVSQEAPAPQAARLGLSEEFRKHYSPDGFAFETCVYLQGGTLTIEEFTESWWGPTAPKDPETEEVFAESARQSRVLEDIRAADLAFRERRLEDVVSLLGPLERDLKKTDRWKLQYAKNKTTGK